MKFKKAYYRTQLKNDPFSEQLKKNTSPQLNLLKLCLAVFFLVLTVICYEYSSFLRALLKPVLDSFYSAAQKFIHLDKKTQFLVLAPALIFDFTRYYITNFFILFFAFFKKFFGVFKTHPYDNPDNCPLVSIIVPVYNEGKSIRHTLDSLLENNYPNFEIIVMDDCSSDRTSIVCKKYHEEGKIIYVRKRERAGKPNSLNYGFKLAKGEIIVHVDGDCIFHRDAIFRAVKHFVDPKVGAVAGNLRVMNDKQNLLTELQAIEYGMCITVQRQWLALTDTLQIASGAFSCFRKEILQNLKGVDTETGEDLDITLKVRKMGYKIAFAPDAIGLTEVPDTLKSLAKQRILWDRCYIRISLRKHFNISNVFEFRFGDFLAVVTDILFNLIILLFFPIYLLYIWISVPHLLLFIALITYLFYTLMNVIQIAVVIILSQNRIRDGTFIFYAPFYFFYSTYLRTVRAFAYILEIFRMRYFKEGAYPQRVWKNMPEHW